MKTFIKHVSLSSIVIIFFVGYSGCKKNKDVKGCNNPNSLNYNKDATINDGSCKIIDPKQRYFVMEIGATHCAPCGSYAIPALQKTIETIGHDNMVGMAIHANGDPLQCAASYELANYGQYYATSIPRFAGGSQTLFIGAYPNIQTNVDKIKAEADKVTSLLPTVNCFLEKQIINDSIKLNVIVKYFKPTSGDYFIAAYVLEDNIVSPQLMRVPFPGSDSIKKDMVHNHVLRGAFGATFGQVLSIGSIIQGTMVNKTFTTKLNTEWKTNNLHYAVIIWKKDSAGIYKYENCTLL